MRLYICVLVVSLIFPIKICVFLLGFALLFSLTMVLFFLQDFYKWPAQKFDEMDSTLAVQQYIQQSIREDFKDIDRILTVPDGQDEGVWKYEHLRFEFVELYC